VAATAGGTIGIVPAPTVQPIIIRSIDAPPARELGLGEVILQAVGLTGLILVASVVLGLALGALLFWVRRREARDRRAGEAGDQIRLRLEPPTARPSSAG
jgi:hypothetical protein